MQNIITKHSGKIVQAISYLHILLFVYAAVSKLLDFENFRVQLAQSPLLSAYAGLIAPTVILSELFISCLLSFRTTRLVGLYASYLLMVSFTAYIYLIINYSEFIPCSCGGIIEKLSWTEHLVFNCVFALLAFLAIFSIEKGKGTPIKSLVLKVLPSSLMAIGVVVALFFSSEHIIKKENNFTRRFGQHPVRDEKTFNLGVNSYYFAGIADGKIYLGNVTAPLLLTSIDTALTKREVLKIRLDRAGHPFRSIQMQVCPPYFFLYDGTVPVIYRGHLGDSVAHTISFQDSYFSQLQAVDSSDFIFRAQSSQSKTQVLGKLSLGPNPQVRLNHSLLSRQVDGMFDTDGQLLRDASTGELVYIYAYRNEFLVMDTSLNLMWKLHTIDTISKAQVRVHSLSDGRRKMDAPPLVVNKKSAVHKRVLFNESGLMGKFESPEKWQKAAVVDMYRTDKQEYLGSFYIQNRGKSRMYQMFATDKYLFVLSGNEIVRYRFAQSVTRHFKAGEAENLN
jgi:hypothetical protein